MNATSAIVLAFGLFSVISNGILITILYLDPLKKFRTSTNYFIISLTISDFLTGAVGCAYAFEPNLSSVIFGVLLSSVVSSFITIFLMSCERFVIVLYPLRAKSLITLHRVLISITLNWIFSAVTGASLGHAFHRQHFYHLILVVFSSILTMVLVLIGFYIIIIYKIMSKAKFQRETIGSRAGRVIRKEHRLTGVLLLLVIVLLLTVILYATVALVISAYRVHGNANVPENLVAFSKYYFTVGLLNFAVNPVIYAWRLPNYRNSFIHYLQKLSYSDTSHGRTTGSSLPNSKESPAAGAHHDTNL